MNRKFAAAALACTMLSSPALAQDGAPVAGENGEDSIVVTAARTVLPPSALPLTIDVITEEALDQQVAISGSVIDAVANLTPSFSPTRQKLSGAGETLRGRSPLYAINGIPQSTPIRDGSRDGYTIDPFFLDRVELIYGSNALQGIGATGGVVNQIVVKAPGTDGLSGRALVQGSTGNFEDNSFGGKLGGLLSYRQGAFDVTGGVAYETRGLYYDGAGLRIGIDNTQGDVQDSQSLSFFARLGYELSPTARPNCSQRASTSRAMATGFRSRATGRRAFPPARSAATFRAKPLRTGSNRQSDAHRHRSRRRQSRLPGLFQPGRAISSAAMSARPSRTPASRPSAPCSTSRQTARASWARASAMNGSFSTRSMSRSASTRCGTRPSKALLATGRYWVPPTTFRTLAPFGQANLKLFDGVLRLAGGARWENGQLKVDDYVTLASYNSARVSGGTRNFDDLLLNGGVIVEPAQGVRAYASYAEGYSIADVGRILRAVNGATQPNFRIEDVNVTPVISNNREIGIEIKRGPLDASASYFWSTSKDGGLLVLNSAGVYDVQRQRIEIQGFEINLAVELPVEGLKVGTGYAHLSGRTDSNKDDKVDIDLDGANISPDRVNLWTSYNHGPLSARVQAGFYLDRRFDGAPANTAFSGYTLTDAVLRYDLPRLGGITLAASNLFDVDYVTYNSQTIRSTVAATDNARFFTGRGRTITLGWDYRF